MIVLQLNDCKEMYTDQFVIIHPLSIAGQRTGRVCSTKDLLATEMDV
jgi:hypothetical protein